MGASSSPASSQRRAEMNPLTAMSAETASLSSARSSIDERPEVSFSYLEDWSGNVRILVDQLEHTLIQAQKDQEDVIRCASQLQRAYDQVCHPLLQERSPAHSSLCCAVSFQKCTELETANNRVARANKRFALAQTQIHDLQTEVDAVYEVSRRVDRPSWFPLIFFYATVFTGLQHRTRRSLCRRPATIFRSRSRTATQPAAN